MSADDDDFELLEARIEQFMRARINGGIDSAVANRLDAVKVELQSKISALENRSDSLSDANARQQKRRDDDAAWLHETGEQIADHEQRLRATGDLVKSLQRECDQLRRINEKLEKRLERVEQRKSSPVGAPARAKTLISEEPPEDAQSGLDGKFGLNLPWLLVAGLGATVLVLLILLVLDPQKGSGLEPAQKTVATLSLDEPAENVETPLERGFKAALRGREAPTMAKLCTSVDTCSFDDMWGRAEGVERRVVLSEAISVAYRASQPDDCAAPKPTNKLDGLRPAYKEARDCLRSYASREAPTLNDADLKPAAEWLLELAAKP